MRSGGGIILEKMVLILVEAKKRKAKLELLIIRSRKLMTRLDVEALIWGRLRTKSLKKMGIN